MTCLTSQAGLLLEPRSETQDLRILFPFPFSSATWIFSFLKVRFLAEVGVLAVRPQGHPGIFMAGQNPGKNPDGFCSLHITPPHFKSWEIQQLCVHVQYLCLLWLFLFKMISRGGPAVQVYKLWTSQTAEAGTSGHEADQWTWSPGEEMGDTGEVEEKGTDTPKSLRQIYICNS